MVLGWLLTLVGLVLAAVGVVERGWYWLAMWIGCGFLVLGGAHFRRASGVFGKSRIGTIPAWSWLLFLPLHLLTLLTWHLSRWLSREPASCVVNDRLVVGRRLLPGELIGEFDNIVDLT